MTAQTDPRGARKETRWSVIRCRCCLGGDPEVKTRLMRVRQIRVRLGCVLHREGRQPYIHPKSGGRTTVKNTEISGAEQMGGIRLQ